MWATVVCCCCFWKFHSIYIYNIARIEDKRKESRVRQLLFINTMDMNFEEYIVIYCCFNWWCGGFLFSFRIKRKVVKREIWGASSYFATGRATKRSSVMSLAKLKRKKQLLRFIMSARTEKSEDLFCALIRILVQFLTVPLLNCFYMHCNMSFWGLEDLFFYFFFVLK